VPLAEAERAGTAFADRVGASSLAALRHMSAMRLLLEASRPGVPTFSATRDGYVLPKSPAAIYAAGAQAHVPLLVGWNSTERGYQYLLGSKPPTRANVAATVRQLYGDHAGDVLAGFPASSDAEAQTSAIALASARFITYGAWKWSELHRRTSGQPVYRYLFARPRPPMTPEGIRDLGEPAEQPGGAVHSAEIEYAFGNLATNRMFAWTADDHAVSRTMEGYFANFVKTGDPNGAGLPKWPAAGAADAPPMVMRIDVRSEAEPAPHDDRFVLLDRLPK
jgi:para-nitrobenzyl esterase